MVLFYPPKTIEFIPTTGNVGFKTTCVSTIKSGQDISLQFALYVWWMQQNIPWFWHSKSGSSFLKAGHVKAPLVCDYPELSVLSFSYSRTVSPRRRPGILENVQTDVCRNLLATLGDFSTTSGLERRLTLTSGHSWAYTENLFNTGDWHHCCCVKNSIRYSVPAPQINSAVCLSGSCLCVRPKHGFHIIGIRVCRNKQQQQQQQTGSHFTLQYRMLKGPRSKLDT